MENVPVSTGDQPEPSIGYAEKLTGLLGINDGKLFTPYISYGFILNYLVAGCV